MAISDRNIDKGAKVAVKQVSCAMPTIVVSKTERPFRRFRPGFRTRLVGFTADCFDETGAVSVKLKRIPAEVTGLLKDPALAIDAVPEKFKVGQHILGLNGVLAEKAAETAIVFTAAHVITALKFGIILVQETLAGVVSTKVPAATPTTAMAYDTAAAALAALPSPDASNISVGYILIEAGAADWDANTDDMTNGSDCTTADFVSTANADRVLDLLTAAVGFVDQSLVEGTLLADGTDLVVEADEDYLLQYTSDGTGALVAGSVDVYYRPYPLARG